MNAKKYLFAAFIPVFTLGALFLVGVQGAHAQGAGVKIQPTIIDEKVDPGSTYSYSVKVTNLSDKQETYLLGVKNIEGISETGQPTFAAPGEPTTFDSSAWIKFQHDTITVDAGQQVDVPFSVWVPSNSSPGGHFSAIFVTQQAEKPTANGSGVGFQVATIVSLQVSGATKDEIKITEFSTDKLLYPGLPVGFNAKVSNTGNTLQRPRGPITITNMFGKTVATLTMNDAGGATIPGSVRAFKTFWAGDGFYLGRYDASIALLYGEGDNQNTESASISFWVVPFKIVGPIIGGLLLFLIVIIAGTRWYVRSKLSALERTTRELRGGESRGSRAQQGMSITRLAVIAVVALVIALILLGILFIFFA